MTDTIFTALPYAIMLGLLAVYIGIPLYYRIMANIPSKHQAYRQAVSKWFRSGHPCHKMPVLINGEVFYRSGNAGLIQNAAGIVCDKNGKPKIRPNPPQTNYSKNRLNH